MADTKVTRTDALKQRFAYDDWAARRTTRDTRFVWNVTLTGTELPGLTLLRVTRLEPAVAMNHEDRSERLADRDAMADEPRVHLQSMWRDPVRPHVLIRVDVFECASEADAREKALWLLGEFESPLVAPAPDLGDVAFASRNDGMVLFVRANLVYLVRNIGRRGIATRAAAVTLDAAVSAPAGPRHTLAIAETHVRTSADAAHVEVTLADTHAQTGSLIFVAPEGEIVLSGGSIVYRGPREGLGRLTSYEPPGTAPRPAPADHQHPDT